MKTTKTTRRNSRNTIQGVSSRITGSVNASRRIKLTIDAARFASTTESLLEATDAIIIEIDRLADSGDNGHVIAWLQSVKSALYAEVEQLDSITGRCLVSF